ncbi:unnamed protein product [Protopolystoma xenopodis]|uniref:Uncharacterized protein n=1 Tax=Protopolystoma xenopodis TaxID=117903 RepID=A0A3S5CGR8_9PLAT|nr:unnamed protein product [Protopolystoma xenopodis]
MYGGAEVPYRPVAQLDRPCDDEEEVISIADLLAIGGLMCEVDAGEDVKKRHEGPKVGELAPFVLYLGPICPSAETADRPLLFTPPWPGTHSPCRHRVERAPSRPSRCPVAPVCPLATIETGPASVTPRCLRPHGLRQETEAKTCPSSFCYKPEAPNSLSFATFETRSRAVVVTFCAAFVDETGSTSRIHRVHILLRSRRQSGRALGEASDAADSSKRPL